MKRKKQCKHEGCENTDIFSRGLCTFHSRAKSFKKTQKKITKTKRVQKIDYLVDDLSHLKSSRLMKIADWYLRQYLLLSSPQRGDGRIQCFIDGKYYDPEQLEVAHYIGRRDIGYRYSLVNCHLTSRKSNSFDDKVFNPELYGRLSKHHFEYRERLLEEGFEDEIVAMEENSALRVYTKQYYLDKIDMFKKLMGVE